MAAKQVKSSIETTKDAANMEKEDKVFLGQLAKFADSMRVNPTNVREKKDYRI